MFVERTATCWLWRGALNKGGYGWFQRSAKRHLAHRWFYEAYLGGIPEGLVIDHLCRVRNCVNPDHLEVVTSGENVKRGMVATATHCLRGHEFTAANTRMVPNGKYRTRRCRPCDAIRKAEQRLRMAHAKMPST
ncbi:MAG: HNH endonuclease [Sulfuritalea sp.]|nr:HNH endonuclease [Sulfuritalea sp.]